jgi:DinB superfamily
MDSSLNKLLWQQFGAAIDMLENALTTCPNELWTESKFWYIGYHTLFFLDYYLSDSPKESDYLPPVLFTKSEFEGVPPERIYDKAELLTYLRLSRQKCHDLLAGSTAEELLVKRFVSEYKNFSILELLLYNMRHVQHHTGQLNLLLRQGMNDSPDWVSRTKGSL